MFLAAVLLFPGVAYAAGEDPSIPLLLYLVVILLAAKLMGHLAVVLGQPAVLGELLAGVLLGNLHLAGVGGLDGIATDPGVDLFARIGVVIMVIVTTLVAPPLLKWALADRRLPNSVDPGVWYVTPGTNRLDARYDYIYTIGMKTAVSIPDTIFRSADSLAKRLGVSRSRLFADALSEYLSRRQNLQVRERLDAIYGEEESALEPDLGKLQARSLPPEEW